MFAYEIASKLSEVTICENPFMYWKFETIFCKPKKRENIRVGIWEILIGALSTNSTYIGLVSQNLQSLQENI